MAMPPLFGLPASGGIGGSTPASALARASFLATAAFRRRVHRYSSPWLSRAAVHGSMTSDADGGEQPEGGWQVTRGLGIHSGNLHSSADRGHENRRFSLRDGGLARPMSPPPVMLDMS